MAEINLKDLDDLINAPVREERANLYGQESEYFKIETWYQDIKDYTFQSKWVDVTLAQAKALCRYREAQKLFMMIQDQEEREKGTKSIGETGPDSWQPEDFEKVDQAVVSTMDEQERAGLGSLKSALAELLLPFQETGAFVKFSIRSPKDAALHSPVTKELLKNDPSLHPSTPAVPVHVRALAFTRAITYALKVTSAEQAMWLFLHSDRVYHDLMASLLELGDEGFEVKLIVREWKDIHPEYEFRAFVYDKQMTACTQYNPVCYVPEMAPNKTVIQNIILDYWNSMKHTIKVDSYTIDFVLSPSLIQKVAADPTYNDYSNGISVIELNVLPPLAGTALFEWKDPADKKIITQGPFELRILEKELERALDRIHSPLRIYIDQLCGIHPTKPHSTTTTTTTTTTDGDGDDAQADQQPQSKSWCTTM